MFTLLTILFIILLLYWYLCATVFLCVWLSTIYCNVSVPNFFPAGVWFLRFSHFFCPLCDVENRNVAAARRRFSAPSVRWKARRHNSCCKRGTQKSGCVLRDISCQMWRVVIKGAFNCVSNNWLMRSERNGSQIPAAAPIPTQLICIPCSNITHCWLAQLRGCMQWTSCRYYERQVLSDGKGVRQNRTQQKVK